MLLLALILFYIEIFLVQAVEIYVKQFIYFSQHFTIKMMFNKIKIFKNFTYFFIFVLCYTIIFKSKYLFFFYEIAINIIFVALFRLKRKLKIYVKY